MEAAAKIHCSRAKSEPARLGATDVFPTTVPPERDNVLPVVEARLPTSWGWKARASRNKRHKSEPARLGSSIHVFPATVPPDRDNVLPVLEDQLPTSWGWKARASRNKRCKSEQARLGAIDVFPTCAPSPRLVPASSSSAFPSSQPSTSSLFHSAVPPNTDNTRVGAFRVPGISSRSDNPDDEEFSIAEEYEVVSFRSRDEESVPSEIRLEATPVPPLVSVMAVPSYMPPQRFLCCCLMLLAISIIITVGLGSGLIYGGGSTMGGSTPPPTPTPSACQEMILRNIRIVKTGDNWRGLPTEARAKPSIITDGAHYYPEGNKFGNIFNHTDQNFDQNTPRWYDFGDYETPSLGPNPGDLMLFIDFKNTSTVYVWRLPENEWFFPQTGYATNETYTKSNGNFLKWQFDVAHGC